MAAGAPSLVNDFCSADGIVGVYRCSRPFSKFECSGEHTQTGS